MYFKLFFFSSRPDDTILWSNPESWKDMDEGFGGNKGNGSYGLPVAEDIVKIPKGENWENIINLKRF